MLARVCSCAVIGLEGVVVEVEVDTTNGLPGTDIVGLPDKAVQESRSRVQAAVKNARLRYPRERIVVNLAPASVRKEGPTYDLPIAMGVLLMQALIPANSLDESLVIGELSLEGTVRHSRGVLPMAATARQQGFKRIFVPASDAAEAALIPDIEVYPVASLRDLYLHLTDQQPIQPQEHVQAESALASAPTDFREIKGQEHVKRALEIAAAGGHNVMMIGPPGAGKTLLARAMPGILPGDVDRRGAGRDAHLLRGGRSSARDDGADAAVPRAASHDQPRGAGGRRQLAASRGDIAGTSRRVVPG